jgi:DNA-binding NarL/FixJ family response regulator
MDGMVNKEIANALALTEGTVKVYMTRIFQKTGVQSRTQLAMKMVTQFAMKGKGEQWKTNSRRNG